jgi:hypothetical protein
MTPILVLLFGVHATTAVGTDLLYAAITKTGGTLTHGVKGTVDWRVTGRLLGELRCSGSTAMVVGLQNRRPGGVNICHQLVALPVPSIGMVAPGKSEISQAELPSR